MGRRPAQGPLRLAVPGGLTLVARTTGFDHVATVTADLDRIVAFYQQVFVAGITFEMAATALIPRASERSPPCEHPGKAGVIAAAGQGRGPVPGETDRFTPRQGSTK